MSLTSVISDQAQHSLGDLGFAAERSELRGRGEGPSMAQAPKVSGAAVLCMEISAYNIIHKHLLEVSNLDFYAVFIAMASEPPMNVIQYK